MSNNIINDLNKIYYNIKNQNINIIIDIVLKYFQKNCIINDKLFDEIINNKLILFNNEPYNIFFDIKDLLNNNIDNYYIYDKLIKTILNDILLLNKIKSFDEYLLIVNKKNKKINNYYILKNQYEYIINNKYKFIPLNDIILYNEKNIEDIKKDYIQKTRYYKLIQTKGYNNNFIILSYLCYFKSAVNIIINHPLFLKYNNINTDSLKGGKIKKNIDYHPYELLFYGGNELWDLLSNDNINIFNIVSLFQNITNEQYIIGLPGIKYYPHIILQYLLYFLNNNFTQIFKIYSFFDNYYYIISLNDNIFLDVYDKDYTKKIINQNYCMNYLNDYINEYINVNTKNKSLLFASTINDPLCYNSFNILKNKKIKINDIKNKTLNNINIIKKFNIKYKYYFKINDYYLQSFIVIENIKNKLDFHCVYFKIEYDFNYNISNIIRYDATKNRFFNNFYYNYNNPSYMINELNIFIDENFIKNNYNNLNNVKFKFNKPYINDYFDDIIYYKICLLCYYKFDN